MSFEDSKFIYNFLRENHNYIYLKAMLKVGRLAGKNETLITGSSHALSGIDVFCFENAVNCSMHTQDIYYDYMCIRSVLDNLNTETEIKKCFIVFGYYIAFQDLSRGENVGKKMLSSLYYPVFRDAHNDPEKFKYDAIWDKYDIVDLNVRTQIENAAMDLMISRRQYYNDLFIRRPLYDLGGIQWKDLPLDKKNLLGKNRAESHNKQFKFKESYIENKRILRECIEYLLAINVKPIIIITPFTNMYNLYVNPEMKDAVKEMIASLPAEMDFIDFNEFSDEFTDEDFVDTDHLNERGAYKLSTHLVEKYGK